MEKPVGLAPCVGCGGWFPVQAGPVHRYMESSPGCWAVYGEVLAREYSDPAYYGVHRLSVDTYAVQHPGQPSSQSIQSVAVHLVSLCLILERGLPLNQATVVMQQMNKAKRHFHWLEPPSERGKVIALDLHRATSACEHEETAWKWAREVWAAWRPHHETVQLWTDGETVGR